ncbi:S24 family peptidase [Pedobacter metabolipauper]|uniref:Phage repressor protein C with HTH and peptisase S24 domain n=1 Tax=Pedobacter metabolipauper TaxID=425513 RepID=A0A4V3D0W5_9SPHI|nr:S24 family peptidase [Pedobacter metabolipauper]TDQ07689.1 phage repressor protein C with HTH and peptisase S24 domain [Pedobacter metabolipauper]
MKHTDLQTNKIGSRLKEVRLIKGKTIHDFYVPISGHTANFSAVELGNRNIGVKLIGAIVRYHSINKDWLLTGEGEMFTKISLNKPGVPFYNVNMAERAFEDFNELREPPEYYVNYKPFNDCDAYMPIYGDSMYPKYASGEIIAVKEVKNLEIIQWGEAYLVVADDRANNFTSVKLLYEHTSYSKIILRSSNPNFRGDTIIARDVIKKLYLVKGKVTRHHF